MTKKERMIRIKYAKILSDLTKNKLCQLLLDIELAIKVSSDVNEKERLKRRFEQVSLDIKRTHEQIDLITSEPRIAKPKLHVVKLAK